MPTSESVSSGKQVCGHSPFTLQFGLIPFGGTILKAPMNKPLWKSCHCHHPFFYYPGVSCPLGFGPVEPAVWRGGTLIDRQQPPPLPAPQPSAPTPPRRDRATAPPPAALPPSSRRLLYSGARSDGRPKPAPASRSGGHAETVCGTRKRKESSRGRPKA